jgi:ATP-dependent DNA helicase RecQ
VISSPENVLAALGRHFGHPGFRPGQDALVSAVLDGHDLLAVMPTGSGKSLGFQLPAVLLPGVTLVVSPLISLMKDQVDELNRRGIAAAAFHSQLGADARRDVMRRATAGELRLLYVAPERFASDGFARALAGLQVARFVVDEAHCVSEWGHDFRPDYRRLRAAAAACRRADGEGRPPMAAFTATATPEVRDDIVELLGLSSPRVVVAGFDRPNISLRVRPVSGDTEKHVLLPSSVGTGRSLVYASTRRKAEEAAETLQRTGHRAAAYHAGLSDGERTRVQDAFAAGTLSVVCATNAFGMGIDRPDVEVVVHMDIPGSLEAYYQEIGRAGRDGRAAVATLFWNFVDVRTREFLIEKGREESDRGVPVDPEEVQRRKALEHKKLRRMISYAETSSCLRGTILRYFGDPAAPDACGTCGNCERRQPIDDRARLLVRKILSGIARAGERYGRRKITAMLIGEVEDLPESLARLSTTGILRAEGAAAVERWIDAACGANLVAASNDEYRVLKLTPLGRDVMAGRVADVSMTLPRPVRVQPVKRLRRAAAKRGSAGPDPSTAPPNLVEALRTWRLDEARRRGIAPFIVLHDRTLVAIASRRPGTVDELLDVPGIGPGKLAEYGEAIVEAIRRSEG